MHDDGLTYPGGAAPPKRFDLPPSAKLTPAEEARLRYLAERFIVELQKGYITAAPPLHNAPHWFSTPIDISGQVVMPTAVTDWTTICEYQVEVGRRGFITQYGVDVDQGFSYNGMLRWRITVNGNPVPTLEEFSEHRGSLRSPRRTYIRLMERDIVRLQVRRTAVNTFQYTVFGALIGWTGRPRRDYDGSLASIAH